MGITILTKDSIISSNDLPRERVSVPEWGGDVFIRTMSGADRDAFEASLSDENRRMKNIRARLVALTLCDETGIRLFSDEDVDQLGAKSASVLDRLFSISQRINKLGAKEESETKKD